MSTTIEEVEDIIGAEAVSSLVANFGGSRIYVPQRFHRNSAIVLYIGAGASARLCEAFRGDTIEIPTGRPSSRPHPMRDAIKRDRQSGATLQELASRYDRSLRQISRILAAA